MKLDELVQLIHAVDKKHKGCSVQLTALANTGSSTRGTTYGIVTIGMKDYQQVFHDEVELREILERRTK